MDATVMSFVRRQRGSSPASCARLQSRHLSAHAGDAGAVRGLVAAEPEGTAHQDRREGRHMWTVPPGKHFLALRTIWLAAVICPASVGAKHMSAGPDEV